MSCIYRFGEWRGDEVREDEFFLGLLDCSTPYTTINCTKLLIYAKPNLQSQREIDYNLLFNYVVSDLQSNSTIMLNKLIIGKIPQYEFDFGKQVNYLIDFLLLFKEELKKDPTIINYILLFKKYWLNCVDKHFKSFFNKPKYLKDMLELLNIADLIDLSNTAYQLDKSLDLDPIYYIATL